MKPISDAFLDWVSAVKHIAEAEADLAAIACKVPVGSRHHLAQAQAALPRLRTWISKLEALNDRHAA